MITSRFTELTAARYVALTTYRRDGTPKRTPVWPVDAGNGRVGFVTSSKTWKVVRITTNSQVMLQPSDAKGRADAAAVVVRGTAKVVSGDAFAAVRDGVKAKYGFQLWCIDVLHALPGRRTGQRNDCAVIVTISDD